MKQYNVITLDITNGLSVQKFGTSGGYLQLQSAPANANVRVHMDDPSAPGILLKTNYSIHSRNAKEFYVSCDPVPGGTISFVQSTISQDFYIETPASDVNVDQIGSYGATALAQLTALIDKNISPTTKSTFIGGSNNGTLSTQATIAGTHGFDFVDFEYSLSAATSTETHKFYIELYSPANGYRYIWLVRNGNSSDANLHATTQGRGKIRLESITGEQIKIMYMHSGLLYNSWQLVGHTLKP